VSESKKYIDKFYENYPKVREYFDKTIKDCERKTYVETMFGRKRYIAGINDRNKMIKSAAEREAMNMPIQ
jgi:DNA polymerase-1